MDVRFSEIPKKEKKNTSLELELNTVDALLVLFQMNVPTLVLILKSVKLIPLSFTVT